MNYKLIIVLILLMNLSACSSEVSNSNKPHKKYTDIQVGDGSYLIPVFKNESKELGDSVGFINQKGDTVIPIGKYSHCWTDTFYTFAIVFDKDNTKGETIAIDKEENILFDIVFFDNGPDELKDGLFRVKRNNKIGYANKKGQIVIPCQFECAFPFEEGKAKVTYQCTTESDKHEEHWIPKSDEWFYIDVKGNKID